MSQTGYAPIQLYRTATASAAPVAGNLAFGELALNYNDGKLYYKNSAGVVTLLASNYSNPTVISVNSASDALRITQTGTGNALVVEDSANPDSTPFVIDANGNVGIGITPPAGTSVYNAKPITGATTANSYALVSTVQSDVTAAARGYASVLSTAAASFTTVLQHFYANQSTIGAGSTVSNQYGFFSESNLIGATNNFGFAAGNTAAVTAGKTAYGFFSNVNTPTGGGTTYGFYAAGTANNYFGGNVGIGVTAPNYKLHLNETTGGTSTLSQYTNVATGSASSSGTLVGITSTGDTFLWNQSNFSIQFGTNNGERMRIDNSGNVGIGTTSPTQKLDVNGNVAITGASRRILSDFSGTSTSTYFQTSTVNASTNLAVIPNGTGALSQMLLFSSSDSTNSGALSLYHTAGNGYVQTSANGTGIAGNLYYYPGGSFCASMNATGNVGIGVFTPNGKLEVSDPVNRTEATAQFTISGSGYAAAHYLDATGYNIKHNSGSRTIRVIANTGGVSLAAAATAWAAISDETQKDIIEPITNAASKLSTVRTVIGKYKTDDEGTRRSFLIAQDIQAVLPEAVETDAEGILSLRYTEVLPLLVAAIKEQQAMIEDLKARVAALGG